MSNPVQERRLVLIRHAKAEQSFAVDDHDRRLTERGRRDAVAAGAWLKQQAIVADLVLCSTSIRTRQTWEGAVRGGAHTEFIEYRTQVYLGGMSGVLQTIREDAADVGTVIVVGHAPTMPALATALSDGGGSVSAHEAMAGGFPTSGIAVLTFAAEWADLGPGVAELDRFHVARG